MFKKLTSLLFIFTLTSFQLANAAVVVEVEPNDTFGVPQTIAPGSFTITTNTDFHDDALPTASITGDMAASGDVDFYCFSATSGQSLFLDIDYGHNQGVTVDTVLSLFNDTGTLIAFDDDTSQSIGGTGSTSSFDAFIGEFTIPATGSYCAAVTSFGNLPNGRTGPNTALTLGGLAYTAATAGDTSFGGGGGTGDYTLQISLGSPVVNYTIGGNVTGLAPGNSVELQNNSGDDLIVNSNTSFTFATALANLSAYAVTVLTQPITPSQTCVVSSGSGNLAGANVTNVAVACTTNTYSVGGTITGLPGDVDVVLQNNGGDDLTVNTNGNFTFGTELDDETNYEITILSSPGYACFITNGGTGTLAGADVNNISINCISTAPVPTLSEWAIILLTFMLLLVSVSYSRKRQG